MDSFWKRNKKRLLVAVLALVLVASIPYVTNAVSKFQKQYELIQEVFEYVEYYHIKDIDPDKLAQGAIDGMLETLEDPYTTYFTDEEYKQFIEGIDNSFTGIGIYVDKQDEYIIVQSTIKNSPAEAAGLQAGDLIIKVDDVDIVGKKVEEAVGLIKGPEGTKVKLTLKRGDKLLDKEVVRAKIQLPLVEAKMLTDEIGYLRLYTFNNNSASEFKTELSNLENQGMEQLVLDLRGNPGGYLNSALEISKSFIDEGPIVYIQDKNKQEDVLRISNGKNWDKPLVVLIDEGTASASEILAGALRDYDKATIMGSNSFGKGTVQTLIDLESGGHLKLTINEYFTPNKSKINGIGIKPDIEVTDKEQQLQAAIAYLSDTTKLYSPKLGTDWIKIDGKDYIALKELSNSFNGSIKYNATTKTIDISIGNEQYEYKHNSPGIIIKNGKSYIDVQQIEQSFNSLTVIQGKENITIFQK